MGIIYKKRSNLKDLTSQQIGTIYAIMAFSFWGLVPIYFKQVSHVDPFEVLSHRIIWSVFVLLLLLYFSKQFHCLKPIFKDLKQLKYLLLSSFFVSLNWLIFIYAISIEKILETSLGYFINPLISVFIGFLFFEEKINLVQKIAIAIVFLAVLVQLVAFGSLPIISLGLAFSFALYGMIRKKVNISSIPGLFIETLLLFPFALGFLVYLFTIQENSFLHNDTYTSVMLLLAGIITVLPLLWFNSGVTRISLTTVGMLQYIGPSISFVIAILIYNEPLTASKIVTFTLIWFALGLFSWDALRRKR